MRKVRKITAAVLAAVTAITMVPVNSMNSFAENEEKLLMGDVNGDGTVDVDDALSILKFTLGIDQPAFTEEAADADASGTVDVDDALTVLKYAVGILEELPAACTEHTWDEGRVVKEATLKEEGLKVYTCTKCGAAKQEVLPVLEACIEHKWDDGKFVDMYFSETNTWSGEYNPGWQLEVIPPYITTLKDTLRQFIVFSDQVDDYDMKNQVTTRYCEEGLKEYTCRICGEKKTDFCVKKRPVPVEADSVKWAFAGGYKPVTSGWTGKYCWLEDEQLKSDLYYKHVGLSEEIYSREQEEALDAISAQFVSGNLGLYEYEAAVREYLSGLGVFDTSGTKGELLIGCNIYFKDDMQHWEVNPPYSCWLENPDGSSTKAQLSNHPFQYIYLNAYSDREMNHAVNFTISLYVENPLLEK